MTSLELEFEGIEELLNSLDEAGINSDKKVRNFLNKEGREFIKTAKDITPEGPSGDLKKSYVSMNIKKDLKDYEKPIRNKAYYHPFVNNGHPQVSSKGKVSGFVPGVHYIEKTVAQMEDEYYRNVNRFIDDLFEELSK